ncbi:hypothetical protein VP409E501_P0022 [Vibrio phage 409E50-1]|nr:hypothetical protein VP521E561_P0022 [Vibrio phage 521E56-1]CAH9012010.1 hypothetical protein VP384E501_P0022 [Vibrio phage 384E50-1]CAH9012035.1 hypothetical protein VP402E501_P0022 [Vibrio phage 402E50-1]CAH9012037.1 hypothetical protein VP409E501_P0022 [Vibrio phage 409E50-1]CAH9013307.1 hypothetical protein VP405E501_P0022 [Vibrio phage 405E50-1]CAH9013361.1 hypothetical protein VP413E501_P0022 [Vibrio phage 413E50-1]
MLWLTLPVLLIFFIAGMPCKMYLKEIDQKIEEEHGS